MLSSLTQVTESEQVYCQKRPYRDDPEQTYRMQGAYRQAPIVPY